MTTCPSKKFIFNSCKHPFRYWKAALRSIWSLLFHGLNSPNSPSLLSWKKCSRPLIIFVMLLWTWYNRSTVFLCWGPQSWTQYLERALTRAKKRRGIISWPAGHVSFGAAWDAVVFLNCYCMWQVMLSLSSTATPKYFSSGPPLGCSQEMAV